MNFTIKELHDINTDKVIDYAVSTDDCKVMTTLSDLIRTYQLVWSDKPVVFDTFVPGNDTEKARRIVTNEMDFDQPIRNRNFKMNNLADARDVEKLEKIVSELNTALRFENEERNKLTKRVKELESNVMSTQDMQMPEYKGSFPDTDTSSGSLVHIPGFRPGKAPRSVMKHHNIDFVINASGEARYR